MTENLHNSKRTRRIGFFTDRERTKIKEDKIDKSLRNELTNPKTGILTVFLRALVNDLSLALNHKELSDWSENYFTRQELQKLEGILDKFLRQHPLPSFRLAAKNVKGKRVYYLKRTNYLDISEKDLKTPSFMFELFTKGLKQNEKKLIGEYVSQVGYELPLKEGRMYEWKELKKLIEEKIKGTPPPIPDEIIKKLESNLDRAWKIIDEKISPEERTEIINKTGYGIRLQLYHSP